MKLSPTTAHLIGVIMNRNDLLTENSGLKLLMAAMLIAVGGEITINKNDLEKADESVVDVRSDGTTETFYIRDKTSVKTH